MKLKYSFLAALVIMTLGACAKNNDAPSAGGDDTETPLNPGTTEDDNPSLLVNGNMEEEISTELATEAVVGKWSYLGGWNASSAKIGYESGRGVKGSKCLSIMAMNEDVDVMFAQKVTGLTPGGYYKATARVKTDMVTGGKGANLCLDYLWAPSSEGVYGSDTNWKTISLDIDDVPESGEITLCLRLGNTAASSTGLVYFDDVTLKENRDLYIRSSEHLRLVVPKDKVPVSDAIIDEWLANLDKVYECYKELFGGLVPFDGEITTIRSGSIGAWAYAGNPIQWNEDYVYDALALVGRGDWCFGLMHEIGHNFAPYITNSTYTWDWNEELFANFRMFYALEKLNAVVITTASVPQGDGTYVSQEKTYVGAELVQLYKSETDNCYDRTIAAGNAVEMGNALCYKFIQIKEKYGWDVYKKAFAELYTLPRNQEEEKSMNHWERFEYFLSFLTKHAGEDVHSCFSTLELNTIKSYLSTQTY